MYCKSLEIVKLFLKKIKFTDLYFNIHCHSLIVSLSMVIDGLATIWHNCVEKLSSFDKLMPLIYYYHTARHKTNANYENLVSDKVEKRVTKNLFYDWYLTFELG